MKQISLHKTLPKIFSEFNNIKSEIWNWEVSFIKNKTYLIQANSGCGKTSLCSYIYGHRNDYNGEIFFDQENIKQFNEKQWNNIRQKHISLLFQDMRLFPELTALENVILKNNLTKFKTLNEIESLFAQLELTDKLQQPVAKMSLGQQQRVAFLRALCQPFDFIILDEPISHIDTYNATLMKKVLLKECEKQKAGIIVTSIGNHLELDYDEILQL